MFVQGKYLKCRESKYPLGTERIAAPLPTVALTLSTLTFFTS